MNKTNGDLAESKIKMQQTDISHLHTTDYDRYIWMRNEGLTEMGKEKKREQSTTSEL